MERINSASNKSVMDLKAIDNLKQYLRIKSVHPNINYDDCITFLSNQAVSLSLPYKIYYCAPKKPILIMTWIGQDPNLPSILLNSHMDVVPVYEDKWTYKPFDAVEDAAGNIFARGAQDMKSVGIQHLEAIRRLKNKGVALKRTVHISFVPDEEVAGVLGMKAFVQTEDFRKLNVGFGFDEGDATPGEEYELQYGERFVWQIRIHCPGQQGHGSLLLPSPPGNKIGTVINNFNEFRVQQLKRLEENPNLALGDVTTVNLTILEGGIQNNVVPPEFIATFDIRLPAKTDTAKFESDIKSWCKEAGDGDRIEFVVKEDKVENTKLDESNKFWIAFKRATDELQIKIKATICPGVTDARHLRKLGIPVFGFSPLNNTKPLLHDNDEYVNIDVFLRGVDIFMKVVEAVANVN